MLSWRVPYLFMTFLVRLAIMLEKFTEGSNIKCPVQKDVVSLRLYVVPRSLCGQPLPWYAEGTSWGFLHVNDAKYKVKATCSSSRKNPGAEHA